MCGRFTTTMPLEELVKYFHIQKITGEYTPLYNAAPSQNIPVIIDNDPRMLVFFRWGLVPSWAKDINIGYRLINARAESLLEKPSFRNAYKKRRCLIAADSFFEWKEESQKKKVPYRIMMKNDSPLAIAGLWEEWKQPQQEALFSCTIITTEANSLLQPIHKRMPAIIAPEQLDLWLDPKIQDPAKLDPLLRPYPADRFHYYPVSPLVNSPRNNSPEVLAPLESESLW